MANYSRKCRHCERWINLRQMPHGRYVAFEGDEPHKCDAPPARKVAPRAKPPTQPGNKAQKTFTPYYPVVETPSYSVAETSSAPTPDVPKRPAVNKPGPSHEPSREIPPNNRSSGVRETLLRILYFILVLGVLKMMLVLKR